VAPNPPAGSDKWFEKLKFCDVSEKDGALARLPDFSLMQHTKTGKITLITLNTFNK
jgi:hypothetical protein